MQLHDIVERVKQLIKEPTTGRGVEEISMRAETFAPHDMWEHDFEFITDLAKLVIANIQVDNDEEIPDHVFAAISHAVLAAYSFGNRRGVGSTLAAHGMADLAKDYVHPVLNTVMPDLRRLRALAHRRNEPLIATSDYAGA